jgi:hypothetical protein
VEKLVVSGDFVVDEDGGLNVSFLVGDELVIL